MHHAASKKPQVSCANAGADDCNPDNCLCKVSKMSSTQGKQGEAIVKANEEAKQIKEKAEKEAKATLDKAKKDAAEIEKDSKTKAAKLENKAKEDVEEAFAKVAAELKAIDKMESAVGHFRFD